MVVFFIPAYLGFFRIIPVKNPNINRFSSKPQVSTYTLDGFLTQVFRLVVRNPIMERFSGQVLGKSQVDSCQI